MKPLASALSVLAVVLLFLKGFDTNGVTSAAEAAEAPMKIKTISVKTVYTKAVPTKTASTKTASRTMTTIKKGPTVTTTVTKAIMKAPGGVTTQTSSATKVK
ncbi:hypothetical protein [Myxococcus xanthus]|uniref:Lipoprotein n=1 Tax=Myxococcus xanthus TaxID=34 RepID=A0A7Y4IJH3_MYXXA|nr:hypothetical protein [Myxococcus xanthus]NOJ80402.1 hypothetical protein [Myxococcus xanthus]NOJ84935.1 hypothetical protein [Myxococcus xanthus]